MPKFARPNSYNGKQANQAWTGQTRAANATEAAAGLSEQLFISPATLASAVGGLVPSATTLIEGVVLLTDNHSPVATKFYADALAIAGAPVATTAVQGIVELATNAEAVSPYTTTIPNTALIPSNITPMFASPPPLGSTAPASGAFTTVSASSTLSVVGASTIAALSATTGAFSSTLSVSGTSTLAAVGATNGTFSGTLGVTGTSTIGVLAATNGTFSGTLGVTGTMTIGVLAATNATLSGTLGVAGASSFSSGTFSTTLGVSGLATLAAHTAIGTANINASGAAATTIATGGTGVLNLGNVTGNTAVTGSLTASTSLTATAGNITATNGDISIAGNGKKLILQTGAATDFGGTAVLVLGTVTVANTNIATGDLIFLSRISVNGSVTLGQLSYTISNGTSFTITSLILGTPASPQTADVSTVGYFIIRPI